MIARYHISLTLHQQAISNFSNFNKNMGNLTSSPGISSPRQFPPRASKRMQKGTHMRKGHSASAAKRRKLAEAMESNDLNGIHALITNLKKDREGQELLTEFVGRQAQKSTGPGSEILKEIWSEQDESTSRDHCIPVSEIRISTSCPSDS